MGVQQVYLDPFGGHPFSFDEASVNDIKSRNPSLVNTDFMLPRQRSAEVDSRPLPLMGATLVGPLSMEPININQYSQLFAVGGHWCECWCVIFP